MYMYKSWKLLIKHIQYHVLCYFINYMCACVASCENLKLSYDTLNVELTVGLDILLPFHVLLLCYRCLTSRVTLTVWQTALPQHYFFCSLCILFYLSNNTCTELLFLFNLQFK